MQRFAPDSEAKAGSRWEEDELPFRLDEQLLLVALAACVAAVTVALAAVARRLSRQRESAVHGR